MNPRTTGILLIVAAALGAFVYLYEIEGGERREEAEEAGKRLFPGVEQDAIASVSLPTTDGAAARLERRDGGWSLVEPLEFPADAFAADGLASNLAGLASETVLEAPQPPEEYGLGERARVVRFHAGDRDYALRLGDKTPIGSNSYAQVEGSDAIVTVATFKAQSFAKSLRDLRERRILRFDRDAVRRIEARWPGASVTLERVAPEPAGDAGKEEAPPVAKASWRLTAPVAGRADDEAVNRLLSDLSFLRADGFVDDPSPSQLAAFDAPDYEVVLHGEASGEGAEEPTWRLALGLAQDGKQRLVRAASPVLYTIAAERISDFPRKVISYRFRRLADFAIGDARRLDFFFHPPVGDPVAITAERTAQGWTSEPEKMAPDKLARVVSELSRLEAEDILSVKASDQDLAALGLAPPRTILSVFGERPEAEQEGEDAEPPAAPRLAEIQIGNVEGSEWIVARAAGDPAVYRLGYELAEHVPVSLEAFRNRFRTEEPSAAEPAAPEEPVGGSDVLSPSEESP